MQAIHALGDPRAELIIARAHAEHAYEVAQGFLQLATSFKRAMAASVRSIRCSLRSLLPRSAEEAFLAAATDLPDLERRLRHLERAGMGVGGLHVGR